MKIIDSHVHFWDPQKLRYAWLDNIPALNRPFLTDHVPAQVGDATVEGIVFVQADCAAEQGLAEVDFVTALAEQDARVQGMVAFAPIEDPDALRPHLERLKQNNLVKGVRRLIQDEELEFAIQRNFIAGVQLLAEYGLSFDICIRHWQLANAIELVRRSPGVQFVLDHCGKPDIRNHIREPWRNQISELATLPNVSCKISGLVNEADWQTWMPEDLQPYIQHVIDAFGPDRIMFGSDAPVAYLASTYDRWVETLQNATAHLASAEQEKLWHTNAKNFYRI